MASSSSASLLNVPRIKHDVFINFRGEDIRTSFLSHLQKELHRNHIDFFVDDQKLHPGDEISSTLLQAIEESLISLVIFSENYASSTWCLNELVKVIEYMKQHQRIVMPVFYNVLPSDVRYQKNSFKEAFDKHHHTLKGNTMKMQNWRFALKEAADLSGFHYPSKYQDESKFIEEIVKYISEKLSKFISRESRGLVGIDESFRSIESLLAIESSEVRMIGIWGMGGIGKTTLAEVLFDKYSSQYEGICMLKNVREQSQKFGVVYLCDKLESELLSGENGSSKAKSTLSQKKLSQKKVFIVLDDVDTLQKLEDLAIQSLGSGSRIIVTTRDKHVLVNVHDTYEVKGLNFENSLKLFCLRAFGQVYPKAQYEEVSEIAVNYANGIPLALKVLGSYLHPKETIKEWKSALGKLKIYPNKGIFDVLKLSYEGLDEFERSIFLDIVFFFKGKDKDAVIPFLESCKFFPADGIGNLCRKALITISENNEIEMHDLIEQMGREIVRQKSTKDPGRRSHLTNNEDVYEVLHDNKGTDSVEGIMLDMSRIKRDLHLDAVTFKKMPNIRFLKFYYSSRYKRSANVYVSSTFESFPNKLRYLEWSGCPVKSLPPNFCAEKLVELCIPDSQVSKLWDGVQDLVNLKKINLKGCKQLVGLPDFSKATNLKEVYLSDCVRLSKLHPSILSIHKLETLIVDGCKTLKSLRSNIHLKSLETLCVDRCSSLKEFSVSSEGLRSLNLYGTKIAVLDSSVGRLNKLVKLHLSLLRLQTLPDELCLLGSLEELDLKGCKHLIELPHNMKALSRLHKLCITGCCKLRSLPELPPSIIFLSATNCTSLEKLFNAKAVFSLNLISISFENCERLDEHSFLEHVRHTMMGVAIRDFLGGKLQYSIRLQSMGYGRESNGHVFYPGRKVPPWFKYQTEGSSVNVNLADEPRYLDRLVGFILCCVVDHIPSEAAKWPPRISFRSYFGGYSKIFADTSRWSSDHVCIWFAKLMGDPHLLRDKNVKFEFQVESSKEETKRVKGRIRYHYEPLKYEWEVIRCGACPVYASNILQVLQNVDPKFQFFYHMSRPGLSSLVKQWVFTLGEVKRALIQQLEALQRELFQIDHNFASHNILFTEKKLEDILFGKIPMHHPPKIFCPDSFSLIGGHYAWKRPAPLVFKVNCGAGLLDDEQLAGFGCIIRDSSGNWIKGCSGAIPFASVLHCQLFAILKGLLLAWECGCKDVVCETDCIEAFSLLIKENINVSWDHSDLVAKIKDVLLWDWTAIVSLIKPTVNAAAYFMAKNSARQQHDYIEWLQPWLGLDRIILEEGSLTSQLLLLLFPFGHQEIDEQRKEFRLRTFFGIPRLKEPKN